MREDYFKAALKIVGDPHVLVDMIWGRVRMLRGGSRPVFDSDSLGKVSVEDIALREIIEGRITYVLGEIVVRGDPAAPDNTHALEDLSALNRSATPAQ